MQTLDPAEQQPKGWVEPTEQSHGVCVQSDTFPGVIRVETTGSLYYLQEGGMAALSHRPGFKGLRHPQVRMRLGTGNWVSISALNF